MFAKIPWFSRVNFVALPSDSLPNSDCGTRIAWLASHRFLRGLVTFDQVQRTTFGFVEHAPQVFTQDSNGHELNPAAEEDDHHQRRITGNGITIRSEEHTSELQSR